MLSVSNIGGGGGSDLVPKSWPTPEIPWTVAYQASLSIGFPLKNTGAGCLFFLQGTSLTQELNQHLLHCRQILYPWDTREVPKYRYACITYICMYVHVCECVYIYTHASNVVDPGSIPGLWRSPGEGNVFLPLQYSCLENPLDRGTWQATVHGVTRVGHNLVT